MSIATARQQYKDGHITFKMLETIFFTEATPEQKEAFWKAPVYDRPSVIEGKSENERDQEWDSLTSS